MADLTELNQRFYRYSVESFDLLFEKEKNPIKIEPALVSSLLIEKDFDNDLFPILRLRVLLSTDMYYRVLAEKDSVRFRLRVQKFVRESETAPIRVKRDVISDIFCIFMDDNDPFTNKKLYNQNKKMTSEGSDARSAGGREVSFFLFKEKDILISKKILNNVIQQCDMTTAITYCLVQAGYSKVLMSPLDNKTSYKQVLLPPTSPLGNIRYLNDQYGFYKGGAMIFFDFARAYILNNKSKCTAWEPEEFRKTVFSIKETINPDSLSQGTFVDEKNKTYYLNVTPDAIQMTTPTSTLDQLEGNNLQFVNTADGSIESLKSGTTQRGDGNTRFVVDNVDNPYKRSEMIVRRQEMQSIAQLSLTDFDIDALTPNKEMLISFEDTGISKTHGGNYRLSKAIFMFAKQGEEFVPNAMISLKKTP